MRKTKKLFPVLQYVSCLCLPPLYVNALERLRSPLEGLFQWSPWMVCSGSPTLRFITSELASQLNNLKHSKNNRACQQAQLCQWNIPSSQLCQWNILSSQLCQWNIPSLMCLFTGRFEMCLPRKVCSHCTTEWTPGVKDLIRYHYWPSTTNCQTLYSFDVFEAFSNIKLSAPSLSRHAFLKLLEHQSVQGGRVSSWITL